MKESQPTTSYKSIGTQIYVRSATEPARGLYQCPPEDSVGYRNWGNFSKSAYNISLTADALYLIALCVCADTSMALMSVISLHELLANEDGRLVWRRDGRFGGLAKNIRLVCKLEDDEYAPWIGADGDRPLLKADLRKDDGTWVKDYAWLDERISNSNGLLVTTL
jgi:CVNH domain